MGLVTIDLHSQKEHTEIHKILKFGKVRQATQRFKNFFVNFEIFKWLFLAYFWVYLHLNLGIL